MRIEKNEQGSSMVEIIGVLAFLATLSVGVFSSIASINGKIRFTRGFEETKRIVKSMREQFASFPPPNTKSSTLYKLHIFDNVTLDGSGNPKEDGESLSVMGYKMEITLPSSDASVFAAMDKTFKLTYYNVESKMCALLLTADWGSDPASGLAEISTGGTTFRWPKDFTETHHPLPAVMNDILTECNRDSRVNITWEFFL